MAPGRSVRGERWLHAVPKGAVEAPALSGPTDEELIAGIVRGDDRVAVALYDRVAPIVDRTLYRIFGRREMDHDDLVQSTFEQIVLTLTKRRFAGACSLATWASTVAAHVGLNALRSRRRERRVVDRAVQEPLDVIPASSGNLEGAVEARDELERLRAHLAAMDPAKAETLFLHDALGHDLAEVAVLTGVSVAAAQSRLVRGRRELMERMQRENDRRSS